MLQYNKFIPRTDWKDFFLLMWFILGAQVGEVYAQVNRDSILANERALDRPLNVHGGQLRISGAYSFSFVNTRFEDGVSKKLNTDGIWRSRNIGQTEIKYGISEHLQITALLGLHGETQREQSFGIIGFPEPFENTTVTTLTKVTGLYDLSLGLDFRIPLNTKKIDWLVSGGVTIPIDDHQSEQPNHTRIKTGDNWQINYEYNQSLSRGALAYQVGGGFKFRGNDWGFSLLGRYTFPSKVVTQRDWIHQLDNQDNFEYKALEYKWAGPKELWAAFTLEYQGSSFLSLQWETTLTRWTGEWREQHGQSIRIDEKMALLLGPGYELMITPRLWFRQFFLFPATGRYTDLGISFYSMLNYNLFVTK